ncbi:recombinase family protein [Chloroflexota bacterium]
MSSKKSFIPSSARTVALCYIRQSYTRNPDDMDSPERQKANIQALCDRYGWTPEWYIDADGHKSGRDIRNRTGWLALEKRMDDPDVAALVPNDLSRMHRKSWRIGQLLDRLDDSDVRLVFAAPGKEALDASTPMGRLVITFMALQDENYANDISERAKESADFRKKQGKTMGLPPFGTTRDEDGYLIPTPDGAWLLTNGRFEAGEPDDPPESGAIWRSYYECAHYILSLYVEFDIGYEKIAYKLNDEGWPFCDRSGVPRPPDREDVRRVLGAWPEYGGVVMGEKAKDRKAYEEKFELDEFPFLPDRAVYDLDLLQAVAKRKRGRSRQPADHGVNRKTYPYALSNITYCSHCLQRAEEQSDPRLKSSLGGMTSKKGEPRYRHKAGVSCGITNRSVPCADVEADLGRLLRLLEVPPEWLDHMTELAIQSDLVHKPDKGDKDPEKEKQQAIALCNRRIDAAVILFKEARIEYEEYRDIVERNERETAHWQARTTDMEKIALELGMCMDIISNMARMWDTASPEDRQGMAHNLFDYLTYDLDTRRITDFRLKPWADRFLILRARLYDGNPVMVPNDDPGDDEFEGEEKENAGHQGLHTEVPHRGLWNRGFHRARCAMDYGLRLVYWGRRVPESPVTDSSVQQVERNTLIRVAYTDGISVSELMRQHRISRSRVYQILQNN